MRRPVVAHHETAYAKRIWRARKRMLVAQHPASEHLMADLIRLFFGPRTNIVRPEFGIKLPDAWSVGMHLAKYRRLSNFGKGRPAEHR